MKFQVLDILIILLAVGITVYSAVEAYAKSKGEASILIRGQGKEWCFPSEAEETVVVPGPLGNTIVRIGGNRAWVESSPCENQTCVASGLLVRQGQWAACLPNNVLLMIQGDGADDVDTAAW